MLDNLIINKKSIINKEKIKLPIYFLNKYFCLLFF